MSEASDGRSGASGGQVKIVAFLAAASGTGCTSTVANLAVVLAHVGRRVLVIDWCSEVPRVGEYVAPFYAGRSSLSDDMARSLLMVHIARPVREDDPPPTVARFELPGTTGRIDVVAPLEGSSTELYAPDFQQHGLAAVADLQAALARSDYDDVLIDAPTDSTETPQTFLATLCDLVVVCFRPRPRAIRDAAELATRLRRQAPIGISLLPVATAFDGRYQPQVDRIRHAIRLAFADLLAKQDPRLTELGVVEIPYQSYDSFDPLLTVLVEEPTPENPLQAAYGRIAAVVTNGVLTTPEPISAELRARYQRAFGLEPITEPDRILIIYAAPDRPWADWVSAHLERSGAQTRALRRGREWLAAERPPGLVVIASGHLEESEEYAEANEVLAEAEARGTPLIVCCLVVDRYTVPDPSAALDVGAAPVTVTPGAGKELLTKLLNRFGLLDRPDPEPGDDLRLPGDRPPIFTVPPRYPGFVGRDDDIEQLRDQLCAEGPRTVTLSGVSGVGKSELALEYAYRFASFYDLVWWVPVGDEQSAMVNLAHLAAQLDKFGSRDFGTTAALDRLASDWADRPFLLIYDNVEGRTGLDALLSRQHGGHVIITSSETRQAEIEIELAVMPSQDGWELLTPRVPGLSREDAVRVADAVGQLPMALELAGTWLAETAARDRRAGSSVADSVSCAAGAFCEKLDGEAAAGTSSQDVVSRVVAVLAASLRESAVGRVTLRLAQMCSFLSQDGIGLDLVRSVALINQLVIADDQDTAALRWDGGEIDRALWTGVRYGLFRVDWGGERSLRLHRIVQATLRATMTQQEQESRRASVHSALAAFAPTEVEELTPYNTQRFLELQKHIFPSEAVDSKDDAVRRWLVNQVRFLNGWGGPGVHRAALGPTQGLLDNWTTRHGVTDPLRLRLAGQLANLYRATGDYQHALCLDDAALAQQRQPTELNPPQALLSALGRGGDLRGLGLFAEALDEDQATWEGFRETLGEDHPKTRMAAHNLASAMFLSGDVAGALSQAECNFRQRLRLLGANNITTWSPLLQIGVYRRELGDYQAAWDAFHRVAERLQVLRPELNPLWLSLRRHQAILARCQGQASDAKRRNGEALRHFRELLGPEHPNTLACQLSHAAAHRAVGGEPTLGIELVESVLNSYLRTVRLVEEHPFVALARLGLGLARCAAGEDGSPETGKALELLRSKLGSAHPWTLAAAVDHARVTAASGDADRAVELARAASDGCAEFLVEAHPHTVAADHNLRLALGQGGSIAEEWREIDVDVPGS